MQLHHALLAAVTAHHLSYTKLGCPCSNSVPALHTRVVINTLHILLAMNTSGLSWVKTDRQTQRPVREALNLYVYSLPFCLQCSDSVLCTAGFVTTSDVSSPAQEAHLPLQAY